MPVGKLNNQGLGKPRRKPDVIDKVREIKQRQQNWLMQREHSRQTDSSKSKQSNHSTSKSAPGRSDLNQKVASTQSSRRTQPKYNEISLKKNQVKQEFSHGMKSRNSSSPTAEEREKNYFNDSYSVCSGAESELERLVSPEFDSSKEPVSEEQFGTLADEIASRVKLDLGISHQISDSRSDFQLDHLGFEESTGKKSWKSDRCETYTQEVPAFNHLGTSGLTSHNCIVCTKLMLSTNHIPMMVIPCGHTMCKTCSEGRRLCPACKCSVVSLTLNVMLQQVIQEYHSYPVPSTTNLKALSEEGENSNSNLLKTSYMEDNRRNRNASYYNQLITLQTRYDVLSKEHKTLSTSLNKIDSKISHGMAQTKNITSQEDEVRKAIENLQERLAALHEHRKQYDSQLIDLQDERTEVDAKATLLSGTISTLSREIEKVKLLAEAEKEAT